MLVKAKWNVKDGSGWHGKDEVFETESELGDAVTVIVPKCAEAPAETKGETSTEPEEIPVKKAPRARSSRKKVTE